LGQVYPTVGTGISHSWDRYIPQLGQVYPAVGTGISHSWDRYIPHTIKRRKSSWLGHILSVNCFLKHVVEGKIERRIHVMGRRGRRRKQLLVDLRERRGYWKFGDII
jgi:hypothetical protein